MARNVSSLLPGTTRQTARRAAWALLFSISFLVLSVPVGFADTALRAARDAPLPRDEVRMDLPMTLLDQALDNPDGPDERAFKLLHYALLERQGELAPGTTQLLADYPARAAAAQQQKESPPTRLLRDSHQICDVDDDGVPDIAQNEIDQMTLNTNVRVLSGADGHYLWTRFNSRYARPFMFLPPSDAQVDHFQYERQGQPAPFYPDNFAPSHDVNGDGVCDLIMYSMTWTAIGIDPIIITITFTYSAVNGSYGYFNPVPPFWTYQITSRMVWTFSPVGGPGFVWSIVWLDMPFAFVHFTTPDGARFVILQKDIYWNRVRDVFLTGCFFKDWRTDDRVSYFDAKNARRLWVRYLNASRDYTPDDDSYEKIVNITYISGIANLAGDDEAEIILDQMQITTPTTCALNNPVDGSPMFRYGRFMTVLMLRGEDGRDGWVTQIYSSGTARVNVKVEESFEELVWVYAQVLPDLTGDGVPEVYAAYLMVERNGPISASTNGRFATHVHPVNGATGAKLWPTSDLRVPGWGFPAGMSADPTKSVHYFALGTIDLPTPVPPGGRFPYKDVRLQVIDARDGTTHWSYRELFGQDSYLSYEMTLAQYKRALAPYDWNGDGLLDVITPSQYIQPTGANQTLLSQATHSYEILDGAEGGSITKIVAWGPTGLVVPCKTADNQILVVSGHSRRIDLSRFNVTPRTELDWRIPIYNNPAIQGATLGTDMTFIGAQCIRGLDDRTVFNVNLGLASLKRGLEIQNILGTVEATGDELDWIIPYVKGKPPLSPEEILKFFEVRETPVGITLAFTAGPAVPGLLAGIGLGVLRRRKGALE